MNQCSLLKDDSEYGTMRGTVVPCLTEGDVSVGEGVQQGKGSACVGDCE